ncbi:hypothetical protein CsSME_00010754 [Camellia sinensis var. sinensis]
MIQIAPVTLRMIAYLRQIECPRVFWTLLWMIPFLKMMMM